MLPFPLFLALKYLRPKRSFASAIPVITLCGVMLGVAILMIVLAVMTGFGDVWHDKILSFKPHITIRCRGGDIPDPDPLCEAVAAVPGVQSVCPGIVFPAMIRPSDGGDPVSVTVLGIDPERPSILRNAEDHLVAGRFDVAEDRAIIGSDLARRLFRIPVEYLPAVPGHKFLCYSPLNLRSAEDLYFPEEVVISGVYDMGMRDFDEGIAICSLGMARDLLGMDGGAQFLQVQTTDPEQAHAVAEAIIGVLGNFYVASTWEQEDQVLFNALRTEKTMMFILLAFIAVVAAFCVTNTLIVITLQKTKEIGLMKALGFSAGRIRGAFVLSGLLQCIVGEALGIGLGSLVLHNLQNIVAFLDRCGIQVFQKSVYGLAEIPWRIVPSDVGAVVGIVFVFCFLASFLPASLAARLDPVKAIQQE